MDYITVGDLPPYFYKYRSLASEASVGFARDIILGSQLYWPSPLDFNDPFDCAPVHEMRAGRLKRALKTKKILRKGMPGVTKKRLAAAVAEALRQSQKATEDYMAEMQRDLMRITGVCSLATCPDSVLMWSHYADSHRGVCLRFLPVAKTGRQYVDERDLHFEFALPVAYSQERPKISILDDFTPQDLLQKILLTKADYWSYEAEWRMIAHREGPGEKPFPPRCLDAIILGAQISDEHRALAIEWNAEREFPATLLQADFDEKLFRLNIRDAN